MTDRERWTIYPLLLLTLGIVLKDKLTAHEPRTDEPSTVVCRQLRVVDAHGNPLVLIMADQDGSRGIIETATSNGRKLIELTAKDDMGILFLHAPSGSIPIAAPMFHAVAAPRVVRPGAKPVKPGEAKQGESKQNEAPRGDVDPNAVKPSEAQPSEPNQSTPQADATEAPDEP